MRLSQRWPAAIWKNKRIGLGIAAIAYVGLDYLRHISLFWHEKLQPALWIGLAIAAIIRVPYYKHWSAELRSALPFVFSLIFMLSALLFEAISVRSVTAVLGLDWHKYVIYYGQYEFRTYYFLDPLFLVDLLFGSVVIR